MKERAFFGGKVFDQRIFFEMFFNDVVTFNILVKLLISEEVAAFKNDDGRVPEEVCDLAGGVEDAFND